MDLCVSRESVSIKGFRFRKRLGLESYSLGLLSFSFVHCCEIRKTSGKGKGKCWCKG